MNKIKFLLSSVATAILGTSMAYAEAPAAPKFYGEIHTQLSKTDGEDYSTRVPEIKIGVKGMEKLEDMPFNLIYNVEAEYGEDLTEPLAEDQEKEFGLRTATIGFVSKKYGNLIMEIGETGAHKHLYSKVDIFDANTMDKTSDAFLFRQPEQGVETVAYVTPKIGNFKFVIANVTTDDDNGADVDTMTLRSIYESGNFNLTINRAQVDSKVGPPTATDNYVRWAVSSSYKFDNFYLAGLVEKNVDDFKPEGDSTVYMVSGKYQFNEKVSLKLGYQDKSFDDSSDLDDSIYIANAAYQFNGRLKAYAEIADYNNDSKKDNINIGFKFKF